jgi:NAD(P)-dependent dehydrogenase (short-subunit alcohol dehydrogenase family)
VNYKDMFSLEGRVALLVGTGGLGGAIADGLSAFGARLALADFDEAKGTKVAQRIGDAGGEAEFLAVDIRDSASVERMVSEAHRRFGRIDILLNAGGIFRAGPSEDVTDDEWEQTMKINPTAPSTPVAP